MKTFVIGDTHGCYDEFLSLIESMNPDLRKDRLVMLGDYIDRGLKSWEMINEIIWLHKIYGRRNVILLRGNHEQMAIQYINRNNENYLFNGGYETIRSFKDHGDSIENYEAFLLGLPLYYEDEFFIYVHSGIRPGIHISNQAEEDLLWLREEFYRNEIQLGRQ